MYIDKKCIFFLLRVDQLPVKECIAKGNAQVMELRVEDHRFHISYRNLRNMSFDFLISF